MSIVLKDFSNTFIDDLNIVNQDNDIITIKNYDLNPIGIETSNPGSLGIIPEGDLFQYIGPTNNDWLQFQQHPVNTVIINNQTDWDNMASGGVITIAVNKYILLNTNIETTHTIFINPQQTLFLGLKNDSNATLNYSGSGTFITGYNIAFCFINKTNQLSNFSTPFVRGTGTLCDINGANGCLWQDNIFWGWGSMGAIRNAGILDINNALFGDCGTMTIGGIQNHSFQRVIFNTSFFGGGSLNDALVKVERSDFLSSYLFVLGTTFLQSGESLLHVDCALENKSRVLLTDTFMGTLNSTNTTLFNPTIGSSGTFSAVADNSFTGISVSVVDNGSGIARYTFTPGPTLYVGQKVSTTGFSITPSPAGLLTYNLTNATITTTGAGYFEVIYKTHFGDETGGTLSSDSVLITTPSIGSLVNGNCVLFNTTGSINYDFGSEVYNTAGGLTFMANMVYVGTATGTWSSRSLNKNDGNIKSTNNFANTDSNSLAFAYVNTNATVTANTAPIDLSFGTLISGSNTERFKLINTTNGTFIYTGIEQFQGFITLNLSAKGESGVFSQYSFNFLIDTGGGFTTLTNNVISNLEAGNDIVLVIATAPLTMNKGDKIKPQLLSSTKTLIVDNAKISIF